MNCWVALRRALGCTAERARQVAGLARVGASGIAADAPSSAQKPVRQSLSQAQDSDAPFDFGAAVVERRAGTIRGMIGQRAVCVTDVTAVRRLGDRISPPVSK